MKIYFFLGFWRNNHRPRVWTREHQQNHNNRSEKSRIGLKPLKRKNLPGSVTRGGGWMKEEEPKRSKFNREDFDNMRAAAVNGKVEGGR